MAGARSEHSSASGPHETDGAVEDEWLTKFFQHLAIDRGASVYTRRNYRQGLFEFYRWYLEQSKQAPAWEKLVRDDFRGYLRYLGRHNLGRAAIQLRFCALRSFYKFLIRRGVLAASPVKNLSLPKLARRLPKFLTVNQMKDLLAAPFKLPFPAKGPARLAAETLSRRDVAVLETIYSAGLRISELCTLEAQDVDWLSRSLRVRGKGKKERVIPIGEPALAAIRGYWNLLPEAPSWQCACLFGSIGQDSSGFGSRPAAAAEEVFGDS